MSLNTSDCEPLVHALREQLQEYGELTHMAQHQQAYILQRKSALLLACNATIVAHLEKIKVIALRVSALRGALFDPQAKAAWSQQIQSIPASMQSLFTSLIAQIKATGQMAQSKLNRNSILAARMSALTEEFMSALFPQQTQKCYGKLGQLKSNKAHRLNRLETIV